jgi:multidrug resistance protein, MATE family
MNPASLLERWRRRWRDKNGYRVVLRMAVPLVLSTGAWAIQQFIDRIFLSWYSREAVAAALPSGIANFTLFCLFIGTASYVNTFVAQYHGAGRHERVGAIMWQGIYLTVPALLISFAIAPLTPYLFHLMGHEAAVQQQEAIYFRILLFGAPAVVITNAISGVFSGLGRPWIIVLVDAIATLINIVFDYLLIFGKWGFPEMGIAGAAWATVLGMSVAAILFLLLVMRTELRRNFRTWAGRRFNAQLFRRLLHFGLPSGLQIFLEVSAFTVFIMIIGKVGITELAASNIAFNINSLAFVPMFGMMTTISTLVGQRLGRDCPLDAERCTWSAFHLCISFFSVLCIGYFFFPQFFLWPYRISPTAEQGREMTALLPVLLRFVAVYSVFDAMNMSFSAALKGAGDTRFVARTTIQLSWLLMVFPTLIGWYVFSCSIYWLWTFITLYVTGLGIVFWRRFLKGPWREMRVIEDQFEGDVDEGLQSSS